jgi:NADH-quinone oxidoreductase subunit N
MPSATTTVAITVGTLVTLVLGVFPAQVLELAESSALFLR